MNTARRCRPPRRAHPARQTSASSSFQITLSSCTGCQRYVTDATTLNALRAQWTNQGCNQTTIVCPAVSCLNPGTAGNCSGADGSPNGICGLNIATPAN